MTKNKVVLIMFFSEQCGYCKMQDPIVEELRNSMGGKIEIIKIDIDKERDIAGESNINATPTLFILKNGNVFKKYVGLTYRDELEPVINQALTDI